MFAGIVVASLVFIAYLGRAVINDLEALSTAQNDDVSWNMSQLEVELLNLHKSAAEAATETKGSTVTQRSSDLSSFRKRYDIFYSRVSTVSEGFHFQSVRDDDAVQAGLKAANQFLSNVTPIVDGPDAPLRDALSGIQAQIRHLQPWIRKMALAGIQTFATEDAARRETFSNTLIWLAASIIALVLILAVAVAVLVKLYRRGQRHAQAIQAARSRFEAAVASSLEAVLVVDTSGRIIEFNGAAETVFGYTRSEALGGDMATMIIPEHLRAAHLEGMARFLDTGGKTTIVGGRVRLEGMRKSGEQFPVELSISLSEADGERVFVAFLRDITRELEAEKQLRNARDKAQESERAKSNLLTVMSHEMRTPLNGILGSLGLIDQTDLDDRQKRHLHSISVSGELLLSHVNDVLDLSILNSHAPLRGRVRFDIRDLVQEVADSLSANVEERGNALTVEILVGESGEEIGLVNGYKTALQQCLINLVGNANKFTTDGVVAIEIERLSRDDFVEIRIADTGVGVAPENLERIFEEFVTIDTGYARENAGTGLGLAITKRIVREMHGEIEADSLLNEGSLFTIRVPLPPANGNIAGKTSNAGVEIISENLAVFMDCKALVVDDNRINRMILMDMLVDLGFDVAQAVDGYQALDLLSERGFDIVLLDISMPGIDGIETLDRLRKMDVDWHDVPVLAVTAHASQSDHTSILAASFFGLLVKPVHPSELTARLCEILEHELTTTSQKLGNDFKARFGREKFDAALATLFAGVAELSVHLKVSPHLTSLHREKAHKLAGSAAILGAENLCRRLQALENCEVEDWNAAREQIANRLLTEAGISS